MHSLIWTGLRCWRMRVWLEPDWDHDARLSLGARLAAIAEIFGGLALVVVLVGLVTRWSDAVASFLFG